MVVVVSDGIFEARAPHGEEFGIDRVKDVVRAERHRHATEITAAIRVQVKEFTQDAPAEDDQTVILIKCTHR